MKKNKRLLYILTTSVLVLMLTLSLSVVFSRLVNRPNNGDNVQMNEVVVSDSDIFDYDFVESSTVGNPYGVSYAKIVGFDTTKFASNVTVGSTDYINLIFPSTKTHDGVEYPVMEINIGVTVNGDFFQTQFLTDAATLQSTYGGNILDKIQKISVPKSVRYISHGAFNQFNALTDIELPFIGTQRARTKTVDDAFLAIFGSTNYTIGSNKKDFTDMIGGVMSGYVTTPSGEELKNLSYYTYWYNYGVEDVDADPTKPDMLGKIHKMVYPVNLRNIIITDEYSIDNHAFFYVPYIESVAVQFSSEVRDINLSEDAAPSTVGLSAFANCYWLKTVALPANEASDVTNAISYMSEGVFRQCESLHTVTNYIDYETNGFMEYAEIDQKIVIPNTTPMNASSEKTSAIPKAFMYGCRKAKYVVLPNDIYRIESHAFENCDNLSIVSFKNNTYNIVDGLCRIPEYITSIGEFAFARCSGFTNVIIPDSVTLIEEGAFSASINIASMTLPFIGREVGSIGEEGLFGYIFGTNSTTVSDNFVQQNPTGDPSAGVLNYAIPTSITNVTITNETYVQDGAFMNCYFIKSLQIDDPTPENETSAMYIGHAALAGCYGLESLSLPFVGPYDVTDYNMTYVNVSTMIPVNSYPNGTKQSDYTLGWIFGTYDYSAKYMLPINQGYGVNYYISPKLANVGLTRQTLLMTNSFYGIKTLLNVSVEEFTKQSQKAIFGENLALQSITMPFVGAQRGHTSYYWAQVGWLDNYYNDFADSVAYFFNYNGTYNMPNSYESSVDCPFDQWHNFGGSWYDRFKASIPKSLANVTITDETYFTAYAFRSLDYVKDIKVDIEDTNDARKAHFAEGSFYDCKRLETLNLPFIGMDWNANSKNTYQYTIGYLFGYGTSGYVAYQNKQFSLPNSLKRIEIDSHINYIAAYAFANMKSLQSFKTDAAITAMGEYCFASCPQLEIVEMNNASYTRIPSYGFYNDVLLHDIDDFAPSTVKTIGKYALSGTSISNVDFSRYDSIETGAFAYCLQIRDVNFMQVDFNINVVLGDALFKGCSNLKNVTLRNDYVTKEMFMDCTSLEGLVYDGVADHIPDGLFSGCTSLKWQYSDGGTIKGLVLSPDSCGVKTIGARAFYNCTSLTTFILPANLQEIGDAAFQGCKGLDSLVIPKSVEYIPYGTINGVDQYNTGAFYNCDDKFYFEVYYDEEEWPNGWKTNWNCYYPVKKIGASTQNMFTYAYSTTLKGYLISGLNVYHETANPLGYKFEMNDSLIVSGTLVFPETYNGVNVCGLAAECFVRKDGLNYAITDPDGNVHHYLENVEKFVLGQNYVYMGASSLIFDTASSGPIFREVYVPNSSNFAKKLSVVNCGDLVYETEAEKTLKSHYQCNIESDLCYGIEDEYVENAIVYYNEAWQYVGNAITWKTSALQLTLNAQSFTYALGSQIVPKIIGIMTNPEYVKYSGGSIASYVSSGNDRLLNIFYPMGIENEVNLSSLRISYSNNINVGTGKIEIRPIDSRFVGVDYEYFTISPYKIDVGYESAVDKSSYGVASATDPTELGAVDHFVNIVTQGVMMNETYNRTTFEHLRTVTIENKLYDSKPFRISSWHNRNNIFLPSSSYTFTGVLETVSSDSGFYIANSNRTETDVKISSLYNSVYPRASKYKDSVLGGSGRTIDYAVQGFRWAVQPRIYDGNGNDVTSNFTFNVTFAVYIKPYVVAEESLSWPGGNYVLSGSFGANYYEYQYTGNEIHPYAVITDPITKITYNPNFKIVVTPEKVTYPTDPSDVPHTATITNYNRRNYIIPAEYLSINFVIVKAELVIDLNVPRYVIGESEEEVKFNFDDLSSFTQEYSLEYTNLHAHRITGQFVTKHSSGDDWLEGTYTYGNANADVVWDLDYIPFTGYKILNGNNEDCTQYFNVTYNVSITIVYNTFDYNLTITSYDAFKKDYFTHSITGPDESIGVIKYNETESAIKIEFGADGYEHVMDAEVHNVNYPATLVKVFNSIGVDESNFKFKELKEDGDGYVINFRLEKVRYYTLSKTIYLKVVKSNYVLQDISKEFDREPVDIFDVDRPGLARIPVDFAPENMEVTYYRITNTGLAIDPPAAIGDYIFKIVTKENHSSWFNDLLSTNFTSENSMEFSITQRSIYIDVVDTVSPFDSKLYDGEPWKLILNDATDSKYNLLPGDSLTGYFVSRSSEIGVYDAKEAGAFRAFTPWSVINSSLIDSDQTSNYKIVYRGVYEIKPLIINYVSSGLTVTYDSEDPQYYSINLEVLDPVYGYRIYYSMVEMPKDDEVEWEYTNKPYFMAPGVYPVYFKIVAPHYETVYGQETLTINAATMQFTGPQTQTHNYDGFAHYLDIKLLNNIPSYATIYYASVSASDFGNLTSEQISGLNYTTIIPSRTEIGSSYYYVKAVARNFTTISDMFVLKVEDQGIGQGIDILNFEDFYDGNSYGPIIDFTYKPSTIALDDIVLQYYIGDSFNDPYVSWNTVDLWQANYGNSYDGKYMIPLFEDATNGPVKVSVRTLVKGYSVNEEVVNVNIKRLTLDLGIQDYIGIFDNKYHTVILTPGAGCYDLVVNDELETKGTISYVYYFTNTLFVDLVVRYHTVYNPMIGTAGFTTNVIKEKNVCNKAVYVEVSANNCDSLLLTTGRITISKNENPIGDTIYSPTMTIEYLARNIQYSDLGIVTPHDAEPSIKWMNNTGLQINNTKDLGQYKVKLEYPDTTNCVAMTIDIDFEVVKRQVKLDYPTDVEYDGYIDNFPTVTLLTVNECTDTALLNDLAIIMQNHLLISKVGTYASDYKDVYNGYKLLAEIDPAIQEYDLVDGDITYNIIKRKLYITFDVEVDYSGDYWKYDLDVANSSTGDLIGIPDGSVKQLLVGHRTNLHFETANFRRGSYNTVTTLTSSTGTFAYQIGAGIIKVTGSIVEDVTTDPKPIVDLYDLVLDLHVKIVQPPLPVEVRDKTVTFDNSYHGLDIVSTIPGAGIVSYNVVYWYEEEPEHTFTSFTAKDVGVYNICYRISPDDIDSYEPIEGKATLIIQKAYLSIDVLPLDEVYDGNYHEVGHEIINSGFVQFTSPACTTYYFSLKMLEQKRVTKEMLDNLFTNLEKYQTFGVPNTEKELYQLYQTALTSVVNAGDYYAYVYYPNHHNYYASYGSDLVTLKRRALYFDNQSINNPLTGSKVYDGNPLYASLSGFVYDDDPSSLNNTDPNAGLLKDGTKYIHDFADRLFKGYEFMTSSANCKIDPLDFDKEAPYTGFNNTDFLFANSTIIKSASSLENLYDNYYPVFQEGEVELYILRAELEIFDVNDLVADKAIEFNGKDALPDIQTPSDGKLVYFYQKVYIDQTTGAEVDFTPGVIYENQKEITRWISTNPQCYYKVFVTIEQGTNYKAWNGEYVELPASGVPSTYLGKKYKSAYVEVVPAKVEIDWGKLETVYNGENNVLNPRFVDVASGLYRYILYDVYDYQGEPITERELIYAGCYTLVAKLGSVTTATGFDSKNYEFLNPIVNYDIKARHYTIKVKEDTDYVFTPWTKSFTEDDFGIYIIPDDPLESWLLGHEMDITLTTNPDMAGRFNRSEHFIITHEVINGFGDSVKNSFTFTIDADIILRDGKIRYEVEDVYTPYDNQYHSIDVKVLSHLNGFKIKYFSFELIKNADGEYVVPNDFNKDSIPWESVTETAPKFKDVGYYRVYFQITVNGENTEIDYADVHIDVADSFILFSELGLDRVYDGVQMGDAAIKSRIKGGYNGNSGQLVFTWFNADDLDNALPYEPYTVGTYAVKVTSNGDNNPAVIQNYTPLNEIYFFEITPATLTLVINSDLVVTGPTDIASKAYIKDNTHRTEAADNDKESILYGLKGSDYLEYDLEFIGHPLEIKIYEHFDKSVPIDSDKLTNFYSDKFTFIWNAYKNNGLTVDNISSNYKLYLDFKLNVHYPNAETKVRNRTFEYTGNPYFFYDGTNGDINSTNNLMMVTFPNVAALTHGDQYSVYYRTSKAQDSEWILARSADDLGFVNPGTYTIYYKVEFNTAYGMYYTPATGSVELTINLQQRVVEASIEKDKLVYNAQKRGAYKDEIIHYDEYGKSIRDYININVTVGNTPNRAEWDILFYDAMKAIENGEEKWIPTGLPYKEIIDAGHYMVELTLPANELYAKTVLYLYLHYTPRNMHVVPTDPSTSFKMNYTGASWRYDVANDPSNFFDTQNLVLGHSLAAATIVCDAVEVGTYTSGFGFETINPGDFVILDASGNDVTHNYAYEINNLTLEIKPAQVTIRISPYDEKYDYPGVDEDNNKLYITPTASLLNPVGYNHLLKYSINGIDFQSQPFKFHDVGTYTIWVRSSGIPNYEDKEVTYTFRITAKANQIVFTPLDKAYDGQFIDYPHIITRDGYNGLADPNISINGNNIEVIWMQFNEHDVPITMSDGLKPINVGKYAVSVKYPETPNYEETEKELVFYIEPLEINLDVPKKDLVYDTTAQAPKFDIYKNHDGVKISYLTEGVDYQLIYFEKNSTGIYNDADGSASKPKNVGSYVMRMILMGDAAKNVKFNTTTGAISKDVYFNIVPREVKVEYSSTVSGTVSIVTVNAADLLVTNLPNTVTFSSDVKTASNVSKTYYYKGYYDATKWNENGTLVWTSTHNGDPAIKFTDGTYDDLSNYNLYIDITIIISNGVVPFTVNNYDGTYDGLDHSFYFKLELNEADYDWEIKYSLDKSNWTINQPMYKDAMTAPVHIYVSVVVYVKGTTTLSEFTPSGAVILCEETTDPLYNEFEVMISRAETTFGIDGVDLNRIYDATPTENPIVTYNYYGSDDRSEEIKYSYFMKVNGVDSTGAPISNYQVVAREDVVNAGDYKLVINMVGSKNYKASTTPIEVEFSIYKRDLYIKVEGDKVYDGAELGFNITNDNLVLPTSVTEAGIVSGHSIAGKILTNSANAGEYTTHTHFKWHEEYTIVNNKSLSVKENYNVIIYGFAKINKATFDFTVTDGHGVYINDSTFYYIDIAFNTTPKVSTNVMEDLLFYTDDPSKDLNDPASYDQLANIGVSKGTKTIYFMIQAENYTTVFGSAQVVVDPINTKFTVTSWPGLMSKLYYSATPYDTSLITYIIEGGESYGRIPTWKFYDENKVELAPTDIPTNAGKYFFKGFVEETFDHTFSPVESDYIPFTIYPYELMITWEADRIEFDALGNPVYSMYYTGSVVTPKPIAYDLLGNQITFDVTLGSCDGTTVGPQSCVATIPSSDPNSENYLLTFVGSKDSINYEILGNGPIPLPPIDPDKKPPFPDYLDDTDFQPGCAYILHKLEFASPQGNPYDSDNPYTYGDEYVVKGVGTYVCEDCGHTVNQDLIFQMDPATGEILLINSKPVDPQTFTIDIDYDAQLKKGNDGTNDYYYHEAIAALNDPSNQSWDLSNRAGSKGAITIQIKVKQDEILESDVVVEYAYHNDDTGEHMDPITDFKFKHTGDPIEFEVRVWVIKRDSYGNEIERIKLDPYQPPTSVGSEGTGDFIVKYFKNTDPTDNGASLCIEALPESGYEFKLGNAESGAPADHYQQFTIYKEFPDYIQLTDHTVTPHFIRFKKVVQNYDGVLVNEMIVTEISYDDREALITAGIPSNTKTIMDGFYEGNTLDMIVSKLTNPLDNIRIQHNNVVIFDGAESQTHTLDASGNVDKPLNEFRIRTGLKIILFPSKEERVNSLDSIEIVLYGDTNCDGEILGSDITVIAQWLDGIVAKPNINDSAMIAALLAFKVGNTTTTTVTGGDITLLAGYLDFGKLSDDDAVQKQYDFNYQYKPKSSAS